MSCEICNRWFHPPCVRHKDRGVRDRKALTYLCPMCKHKRAESSDMAGPPTQGFYARRMKRPSLGDIEPLMGDARNLPVGGVDGQAYLSYIVEKVGGWRDRCREEIAVLEAYMSGGRCGAEAFIRAMEKRKRDKEWDKASVLQLRGKAGGKGQGQGSSSGSTKGDDYATQPGCGGTTHHNRNPSSRRGGKDSSAMEVDETGRAPASGDGGGTSALLGEISEEIAEEISEYEALRQRKIKNNSMFLHSIGLGLRGEAAHQSTAAPWSPVANTPPLQSPQASSTCSFEGSIQDTIAHSVACHKELGSGNDKVNFDNNQGVESPEAASGLLLSNGKQPGDGARFLPSVEGGVVDSLITPEAGEGGERSPVVGEPTLTDQGRAAETDNKGGSSKKKGSGRSPSAAGVVTAPPIEAPPSMSSLETSQTSCESQSESSYNALPHCHCGCCTKVADTGDPGGSPAANPNPKGCGGITLRSVCRDLDYEVKIVERLGQLVCEGALIEVLDVKEEDLQLRRALWITVASLVTPHVAQCLRPGIRESLSLEDHKHFCSDRRQRPSLNTVTTLLDEGRALGFPEHTQRSRPSTPTPVEDPSRRPAPPTVSSVGYSLYARLSQLLEETTETVAHAEVCPLPQARLAL
ncbi:unnamed protein product, partial [Discosporangium mesarthrocarpum]